MNNINWDKLIEEKQKKLNSEIHPETDLWRKIDHELGNMRTPVSRQILNYCFGHKPVFAAVSICLIIGIVIAVFSFRGYFNNSGSLQEMTRLQEFASAEKEYEKAKQSLLELWQKSGMPEKEVDRMKNNLKQIDDAIDKMRNIVIEYPDNKNNGLYLADLYKQETMFLNRMKGSVGNIN